MKCILVLLALMCVGAAPDTQPTTQPVTIDGLKAAVETDRAAVDAARQHCLDKLGSDPAYKALSDDLAAKSAARNTAREGDDAGAKLRASAEYVVALTKLKQAKADAIAEDPGVREVNRQLDSDLIALYQAQMAARAADEAAMNAPSHTHDSNLGGQSVNIGKQLRFFGCYHESHLTFFFHRENL